MQCNVQQTDSALLANGHVAAVSAGADVIGWNELGTTGLQNTARNLPGFESYLPNSTVDKASTAGAVGISWRTAMFRLVEAGNVRTNKGVFKVTPTRWINWVLLEHIPSSKQFYRINTHVVHHIEAGGKARIKGAILGQNGRAERHFAALAKLTAELGARAPVLGGGDLNVNYLAEKNLPPSQRTPWFPYTVLGSVAQVVMNHGGTHGGRSIDWTWIVGAIRILRQQALPHGSSDHNPVRSTVELT